MGKFRFKQFSMVQEHAAMKIGTDGILLGAWANLSGNSILDIGTGTGLLGLISAQKNRKAEITAIEISEKACIDAKKNIANSPWKDQIQLIPIALQEYQPSKKFDVIITNPPYFVNSLLSNNPDRNTARHTSTLLPEQIIEFALKNLTPSGRLVLIYPIENANEFIESCTQNKLYLTRYCDVQPTAEKVPHRKLMEFEFQAKPLVSESLIIEISRHVYTKEYIEVTKDFNLNM